MPKSSPTAVADLAALLPGDAFATDTDTLVAYGRDWTRVYEPRPSAVVFPRSAAEVAQVLRHCSAHNLAVVPSGGRTGLAGGAVAAHGEVVLSLERMRALGEVDTASRTVRVEAGAVTKSVHEHVAPFGLSWPVDFASSGSSHIGGNIATNAGGVRVVRYGLTRQWVLGLEVVTMAGDVLLLNGELEKNNTGVDLRHLFVGTEGTLGVITAATLKLAPLVRDTRVALLAVESLEGALELFRNARRTPLLDVLAFEYLSGACLEVVMSAHGLPPPTETAASHYVLVELDTTRGADGVDAWFEQLFEQGLVADGALAQSSAEAKTLWTYREGITECLGKKGLVHKNDIAVPIRQIGAFMAKLHDTFAQMYAGYAVYVFGHLGDGNLHVNTMKPEAMAADEFFAGCHRVDHTLFDMVRQHGGSISAEHGVGLIKKAFLPYTRTESELTLMRGLKRVFDPKGLLNPGKIFD